MCELAQKKTEKEMKTVHFLLHFLHFCAHPTHLLSFVTSRLALRRRRRIEGLANWVVRRNGRTWGKGSEFCALRQGEEREAV